MKKEGKSRLNLLCMVLSCINGIYMKIEENRLTYLCEKEDEKDGEDGDEGDRVLGSPYLA